MNKNHLPQTLKQLIGHLVVDAEETQHKFDLLIQYLADTLVPDDKRQAIQSDFSIGRSDLFSDAAIPRDRLQALDLLANHLGKKEKPPAFRVFVREVPVREQLLQGSVPAWAAGANVSHSIGPFTNKDGRKFWYDFFRIEKLIALYVQGIQDPVLLFKVRWGQSAAVQVDRPIRVSLSRTYALGKGSIWINARILAPNAPQGTYTGLTINGGTVTLSSPPTDLDGKLTAVANTTVTVQIDLNQIEATNNAEDSYFGIDARNLELALPNILTFHFSSQGRTIDSVGDARWNLYGQPIDFTWDNEAQSAYDGALQRIVFPFYSSEEVLQIRKSQSQLNTLSREAPIMRSGWALSVASIDITQPTEAAGTGEMFAQCDRGLTDTWQGLKGGGFHLAHPALLISPGQIFLADLTAGNPHVHQSLELWKDELNPFGTSADLTFPNPALFFYVSNANGNELFMTFVNAAFQVDRPVMVNGEPPAIRSLNSVLQIAASATNKLIYLFDNNLIQDGATLSHQGPIVPQQIALALTNALFKVTQVNGCLLFGSLSDDYTKVTSGFLFLTFGLYAYLPTLPDPYAANLGILRNQLRGQGRVEGAAATSSVRGSQGTAWLVCRVRWQVPAEDDGNDEVIVSFHFATLDNQFGGISFEEQHGEFSRATTPIGNHSSDARSDKSLISQDDEDLSNYEEQWNGATGRFQQNLFALLDVSTRADLFGISFSLASRRDQFVTTHAPVSRAESAFPIQVEGMEVVSQGKNAKVFTVPQISWEPIINLPNPKVPLVPGDPAPGFNYFPNDGGPMQIINNSEESVALAPLPLTDYLVKNFEEDTDGFAAFSLMTLPFGLKALAVLQNQYAFTDSHGQLQTRKGTDVLLNSETFQANVKGGLQLQLNAGEASIEGEGDMFVGSTLQLNNVLDLWGYPTGNSNLGRDVTEIFNNEFLLEPLNPIQRRGVPLTRIDLSGYGASTFSKWLNPTAAFAETSQSGFDVVVGRCAHEVIQVKSLIYPGCIKAVRTITIFRTGSGYVYRFDSGWQPESDGEFDCRYFVNLTPNTKVEMPSPFEVHPGIVNGMFDIKNIVPAAGIAPFEGNMVSAKIVDENGLYVDNPHPQNLLAFKLQPLYFDADVEIEGVTSGFKVQKIKGVDKNVVPSKNILGYVQIEPRGIPITRETLRDLVNVQLGAIGGPLDCEVNLASSDQKMRLNRFDFNNAFAANESDVIFPVAGRGSVLLPRDGSWTMVKHERDTGEVSPVPPNLSVPVIRAGKLIKDGPGQKLDTSPESVLLRIANPSELLRKPANDTVNFGFLQSTDTQKALFLTPSFEIGKKKLFSKTSPLFVDAFRIVNSKAIFPNIGNAENDLGIAIPLVTNGNEFLKGTLKDASQDVWELMDVTGAINNTNEIGYQLLKKVPSFGLPSTELNLIDLGDGNFRIYIEYKGKNGNGELDFGIDSLNTESWKSKMSNIGLVVDLAGIRRLMIIRGSWDSKKGSAAAYPQPELEFAPELKPVIDILEILQQLQGGDYAGATSNGLKLAMSNKAGSWEYKFEASKEIPVLRFPVPGAIYNDPNTPFKLEAGLKIGAYFNAALKVTTSANELLPSAGGSFGFYGRLSVMCVSLSAATIYAIGQVNLDIAADTKIGPSLRMKFGFGAQIVIGLPVAGNVSVLFVVGVEIFAASGIVEVTAFMLFEGHAEILAGLVAITIRIEAKGTVSRKAVGDSSRTDLACQVTFGIDISIFLVININFETSWSEQRQIA